MDKIARQLNANGLDLKEIELFLTFIKKNNFNINSLKEDVLNSTDSKTEKFFKSKLSTKMYAFYILKHSLQQQQDQYVKIKHDINCDINTCPSLKRIIDALKYYKPLYNNNNNNDKVFNQLIIKYFQGKNKYIISDYHHLLSIHLNQTKIVHLQNFEIINDAMYKNKLQCDINECNQYLNYQRDREITNNDDDDYKNDNDYKVKLYSDLMDTIHCYLIHGFDDGSRLRIRDLISMTPNNINYNDITDEESIPYKDDNLKQLQQLLEKQRQFVHKLRNIKRVNYNKFNDLNGSVNINASSNNTDNEDDKKISNNNNECKNNQLLTDKGSNVGLRFYYWSYYRNNNEEDKIYHPGQTFSDWYIDKKYTNFKQEIISNNIHKIDINVFNYVLFKANILIKQSDYIQGIKSSIGAKYGIQEDYKITNENVMALIFYSDFDKFRMKFAQTFQLLNEIESDKEIKDRNREFWFLSKKLIETVECYGTQLIDQKLQLFYTLINEESMMNETELYFNKPLSSTPHLEIVTIYRNNNGALLELCPNNYSLKLFNCSFISSFGSEDAILFFGHIKPITIHSIINLNNNENYRVFIKAITIFNRFINGKILNKQRLNVTNMDYFIINSLSKNKNKNIFPKYINDLFECFCINKIRINLNIRNIESYYPGFAVSFISSKCDNLVKFDLIVKIFKNCKDINVEMMDYGSITSNYLTLLQKCMDKLSKITDSKLNTIILNNAELKENDDALENIKEILFEKGWKVNSEQNKSNNLLNISINKK